MHEINRSKTDAGRTRSLTGGTLKRILLLTGLIVGFAAVGSAFAGGPKADKVGPITFEPNQGYVLGNINGQQGWMKSGAYDVAVAGVSSFPAASGYGFGTQALRLSNAVVSGSFGDQTFSPGSLEPGRRGVCGRAFQRAVHDRYDAGDRAARPDHVGEPG